MKTNDDVRFIIIDDDSVNNLAYKYCIKTATGNENILSFTDARDALKFIEHEDRDATGEIHTILFIDISMPVMNGWETVEKFGELPAEVIKQFSVYMISSTVNPLEFERARTTRNVCGYVTKPLTKQKVIEIAEQTKKARVV